METVSIRAYNAVMETRHGVDHATVYDDPIEPKYPTVEAAIDALMAQLGYVPAKKENSGYPGYWDGDVGAYFDYIGSTDIEIPETIVQRIIRSRQFLPAPFGAERNQKQLRTMKIIEAKIYAPVEGKPGLVKEIGKRKAVEVFKDLEQALRDLYLYPDEYFLLSSAFSDPATDFPEVLGIQCYAQWGGSEGIYLEVDLAATIDGEYKQINFATGKTLDEDSFAFDKMQYTAGVIYKLLMGDHMRSSRYCLEPGNSQENDHMLQSRVQNELREYFKNVLFHGNEPLNPQKILQDMQVYHTLSAMQLIEGTEAAK